METWFQVAILCCVIVAVYYLHGIKVAFERQADAVEEANCIMMAAMKPEELKQFFEAARQLEALEQDVLTQQAEVEKRIAKAKLPYGD